MSGSIRAPARFAVTASEEWRAAVGYEGRYEVSSEGRVRSLPRVELTARGHRRPVKGGVLKPQPNTDGYFQVTLRKDGKRKMVKVSRLVAFAHIGPGNSLHREVAHLNGIKTEDRVSNLGWVSPRENTHHRRLHGTMPIGERAPNAKLTDAQAREIKTRLAAGEGQTAIARDYPVGVRAIDDIKYGRRWRHVEA